MSEFEHVRTSPGDGDTGFEFKRPAWQQRAACRGLGPDWFFVPVEDNRPQYNWNKIHPLCGACPVHQQCFEWALEHEDEGVWAATTPSGRVCLRKAARIKLDVPGGSARDLSGGAVVQDLLCGTEAGWQRHRRAGTTVCDKCRVGKNLVQTERRRGSSEFPGIR